jgi:steroid 5-alpha reductase family enzyme
MFCGTTTIKLPEEVQHMDVFTINLWICAAVCVLTWVMSVITNEHSWVDRIWSIIPIVYMWVFAAGANFADARLNVLALLVTLWGARLTFNFARKGGYAKGGEDYRWEVLRQSMPRWRYELFNIFFIVIYQNALLLMITLPAWTILQSGIAPFGPVDLLLTIAFLGLLLMETVADQQQWNFHKWKNSERAAGRIPNPGFIRTGLFGISRHPNFFSEQAQWWVVFLFGAAAAGSMAQWTVVGAFLLTILFIGSTKFTEDISLSKYPDYAQYQRRVSMLIPWFPKRGLETSPEAVS